MFTDSACAAASRQPPHAVLLAEPLGRPGTPPYLTPASLQIWLWSPRDASQFFGIALPGSPSPLWGPEKGELWPRNFWAGVRRGAVFGRPPGALLTHRWSQYSLLLLLGLSFSCPTWRPTRISITGGGNSPHRAVSYWLTPFAFVDLLASSRWVLSLSTLCHLHRRAPAEMSLDSPTPKPSP